MSLHIEAEITKGKYHDNDTFLGPETAYYLKLYLEQRRKGTNKMPPETITDDSPLIRDTHSPGRSHQSGADASCPWRYAG